MIIDFHTHAFPDALAPRAIQSLEEDGGCIQAACDGTVAGLVAQCRGFGVDHCVVLNIATNPKQQKKVNDFAISTNGSFDGHVISFGSVHPDAPDALSELDRIKEAGLLGVKFHPDYQEFFTDDPRLFPIYEKIGRLGLITVFHAGMDFGLFEPVHCMPAMLAAALPHFGGAPVVAAHFGGDLMWYDVEKFLVGRDVYFDTSFCHARIPFLHARRIVENHGADRVLFGTDSPWGVASRELRLVDSLNLPEERHNLVLGENARRLLGL